MGWAITVWALLMVSEFLGLFLPQLKERSRLSSVQACRVSQSDPIIVPSKNSGLP